MSYSLEGILRIPRDDFCQFVNDQAGDRVAADDPCFCEPRLLMTESILRVGVADGDSANVVETADIPLELFWDFVKDFAPSLGCDTDIDFGVPAFDGDELVIGFAADSECAGRSMDPLPECLRAWESAPDVLSLDPARAAAQFLDEMRREVAESEFERTVFRFDVKDSDHGFDMSDDEYVKRVYLENGDNPSILARLHVRFHPDSAEISETRISYPQA